MYLFSELLSPLGQKLVIAVLSRRFVDLLLMKTCQRQVTHRVSIDKLATSSPSIYRDLHGLHMCYEK